MILIRRIWSKRIRKYKSIRLNNKCLSISVREVSPGPGLCLCLELEAASFGVWHSVESGAFSRLSNSQNPVIISIYLKPSLSSQALLCIAWRGKLPHLHSFLSGARREGSHPFFLGSKFLQSSFRVGDWTFPVSSSHLTSLTYDESFLDTDRVLTETNQLLDENRTRVHPDYIIRASSYDSGKWSSFLDWGKIAITKVSIYYAESCIL